MGRPSGGVAGIRRFRPAGGYAPAGERGDAPEPGADSWLSRKTDSPCPTLPGPHSRPPHSVRANRPGCPPPRRPPHRATGSMHPRGETGRGFLCRRRDGRARRAGLAGADVRGIAAQMRRTATGWRRAKARGWAGGRNPVSRQAGSPVPNALLRPLAGSPERMANRPGRPPMPFAGQRADAHPDGTTRRGFPRSRQVWGPAGGRSSEGRAVPSGVTGRTCGP